LRFIDDIADLQRWWLEGSWGLQPPNGFENSAAIGEAINEVSPV
jgi:hypothetical protein